MEPEMPHVWRVTLLGEMCFYDANAGPQSLPLAIDVATQKTRLLLAYLLLNPRTAHTRERLAAIFWPDSDPERSRRSLRGAISALKKAFATMPDGRPAPALWVGDTQNVRLVPGLFASDVSEWQRLRERADHKSAARLDLLRQAVELYGGPLLPGMDDLADAEPWIAPLRMHYAAIQRAMLWEVSRLSADENNLLRAVEFARRARDADDAEGFFDPSGMDAHHLQKLDSQITEVPTPTPLLTTLPDPKASTTPGPVLALPQLSPHDTEVSPMPPQPVDATPPSKQVPVALPSSVSSEPVKEKTLHIVERVTASPLTRPRFLPLGRRQFITGGLTAVGGAVVLIAALVKRPWQAPHPPNPVTDLDTGKLFEGNGFVAAAAQAMQVEDYGSALGSLRSALAIAKTDQERYVLAEKLYALGCSAHWQNKGKGGITIAALEDARPVFLTQGRRDISAHLALMLTTAYLLRGERAKAVPLLAEARRTASALLPGREQARLIQDIGDAAQEMGDCVGAKKLLSQSLAFFLPYSDNEAQKRKANLLGSLGEIACDQCEFSRADAYLRDSAERLVICKDWQTWAAVQGLLGQVEARQGRPQAALPFYQRGLKVWSETKQHFWVATFQLHLAHANYYLGRYDDSFSQCSVAHKLLSESNGPVSEAAAYYIEGLLHLRLKDFDAALSDMQTALKGRKQSGKPRHLAEALEGMARVEQAMGNKDAARLHLREAIFLREQAKTPVPPCDQAAISDLHHLLQA